MRRIFLLALAPLVVACADSPTAPAPSQQQSQSQSLWGLPFGGNSDSPRLLICPSLLPTVSVSGTLDALGGTLSAGAVRLEVPAGALAEPTLLAVAVPPSLFMETRLDAVGIEHFVFQQPVTVTIDYSRCSRVPQGATLRAVYIDPITKRIREDMGGTVDADAHTLTFTTGHFSSYAVAY
jgi:hypothetical protein